MQPIQPPTLDRDSSNITTPQTTATPPDKTPPDSSVGCTMQLTFFRRLDAFLRSYWGTLILNILYAPCGFVAALWAAFFRRMITEIYPTGLSPFVPMIEAGVYTLCVAEIFNDGLPRAVWATIGHGYAQSIPSSERTRSFGLVYTLITAQCLFGFVLSLVLFCLVPSFVRIFAPTEMQELSTNVIRVWAFHATPWLAMTALTNGVRAYGHPFFATFLQIQPLLFQMLFFLATPTRSYPGVEQKFPSILGFVVSSVAGNQFGACLAIFFFFLYTRKMLTPGEYRSIQWFSSSHFMELYNVGKWTFLESVVRNAVYMWQMHNIASLGLECALVWATFNIVRRTTVDIPIRSLELTTNTFVGHHWQTYLDRKECEKGGELEMGDGPVDGNATEKEKADVESEGSKMRSWDVASWCEIREPLSPALKSTTVAFLLTVPLVIWVTLVGARRIAQLYGNEGVTDMVAKMWTVVGAGIVLSSVTVQVGSVIMVVAPKWYFLQSLAFTAVYSLPCAVTISALKNNADASQIWGHYKWMVGGSYVVGTLFISITGGIWVAKMRGRALMAK